jgi:TolB protein
MNGSAEGHPRSVDGGSGYVVAVAIKPVSRVVSAFAVLGLVMVFALAGQSGLANGSLGAGRAGVIAFEASAFEFKGARSGLYLISADGRGRPRRIPGSRPGDGDPRWSPDGKQLSFDRWQHRNRDVYVMNADGSGQRRLTFALADDEYAAWAPNGRSLAFESERDGVEAVYVINVGTGAARRVAVDAQYPDWTKDGRIIFTSSPVPSDLFTVRRYGSKRRPLKTQPGDVLSARVSREGGKLVYDTINDDIYSSRIDGSQSTRLVSWRRDPDPQDPAWSPDGKWVAFDRALDPDNVFHRDIYLMRADGSQVTRLTSLETACCPDWTAAASRH